MAIPASSVEVEFKLLGSNSFVVTGSPGDRNLLGTYRYFVLEGYSHDTTYFDAQGNVIPPEQLNTASVLEPLDVWARKEGIWEF